MPVSKLADLPAGGGGRVYPGSDFPDEVARAGEVYFFRTGHYLVYEADRTEVLEWNPADALQFLMDHIEEHAQRVVATLAAESTD